MKFFLRTACFIAGFGVLLALVNTYFVTTDTLAYLAMDELTKREDIEIAFVGSSVTRNHFVPEIIKEKTGLTSYNVSQPYMGLQGSYFASKLLFKNNDPKYMVLVIEPYHFSSTHESIQTQFRLLPFLKNPIDRIDYYLNIAPHDDRWLDRLLLPREFPVTDFEDFKKTLRHHIDVDYYYDLHKTRAAENKMSATYMGSGHMHPGGIAPYEERMGIGAGRGPNNNIPDIPEYSKYIIERFVKLCEKHGAQPIAIVFPYHPGIMLSNPDYMDHNDNSVAYCRSLGVPTFNFALAKESLLPPLDEYFQNTEHMSIEGAQALSLAFCEVFNRHLAGEDVSDLFHADRQAYRDEIDRMVNVWVTQTGHETYAADSNHGTYNTPVYAFHAVAADGSETVLREASSDPVYRGAVPAGTTLRVYGWVEGQEARRLYYDLR